MSLLSRALGADGFGRWWWTFVLLEVVGLLGMNSADLYVRKELPRHQLAGDTVAAHSVVSSALVVSGGLGAALCALQVLAAHTLANTQNDPALGMYIAVLAVQPVLTNLTAVLAAALQSINAYGAVAIVRGIAAPLLLCAFLLCAWLLELPVGAVLLGLVAVSAACLLATIGVYTRHFELRRTIAGALPARRVREVFLFGLPLVIPNALWVVGGKIDLYLLRPHVGPAVLGVYGACLQLVSILPNVRTVFDPIVQAQIASLSGASSRLALGHSLQRLSRMCALVLLPFFVALVTLGEPTLSFLLGRAAPNTAATLVVLSLGQFCGSIAVGSWLTPMLVTGRALSVLAATALICKTALLLTLAPRIGALGAAIATAVGTVLAQQGMAVIGSRLLHVRVFSRAALHVGLGTLAAGVLSATVLHSLGGTTPAPLAYALGALVAGAFSLVTLFVLLDVGERARVRGFLRSLGVGG